MLIIGERINASRNYIAKAISSGNAAFIQNEAKAQDKAGAEYIDVNAGVFVGEEKKYLQWLVKKIQEVTDIPLCIDSPDPEVIEAVLPLARGRSMINSITLEPSRMERMLPLAKEHKTKIIALCQSEQSMAETVDEKVKLAGQLVDKIAAFGLSIDDLYIDPLVYPLSTNSNSATASLSAIERIMTEYPGVHTTCGLTNVSFGLPNRKLINRTFLVAAITRGLDSAIIDPTDRQLYSALKAALTVVGKDEFCMEYITAFREGDLE